jgi:hypothetical protein
MANSTWDRIAGLFDVRDATADEISQATTDSDLLKVSPAAANYEAQGSMPGDVGSYMDVGKTFEQIVAGLPVYVTDLRVSNWRGYRQSGGVAPGYFIRPAREVDSATAFVPGYSLKYVPAARWNTDLERHVYLNYVLGCDCEVEHLDVLEIDDQGVPLYTGTVWRYTIGNVGQEATHVIIVDPATGLIQEYPIDQAPAWIDRIYSLEKMKERAEWWAKYSEWDETWGVSTTLGKMQVDAAEDVYGHDGRLYYMITVSSSGSDQTLKWEFRVDPRTAEAVKYPASGKTIEAVKQNIRAQKDSLNRFVNTDIVECERQSLVGVTTYYCILETTQSNEERYEESSRPIAGYAMVQERFSSQPAMTILEPTFNQAWDSFRLQLTQSASSAQVQGEAAQLIVFSGTLLKKADYITSGKVWFILTNQEFPQGIYFQVSQDNPVLALSQDGQLLEVTAFDLRVDQVNDVVGVINHSLPPVTVTP